MRALERDKQRLQNAFECTPANDDNWPRIYTAVGEKTMQTVNQFHSAIHGQDSPSAGKVDKKGSLKAYVEIVRRYRKQRNAMPTLALAGDDSDVDDAFGGGPPGSGGAPPPPDDRGNAGRGGSTSSDQRATKVLPGYHMNRVSTESYLKCRR